MRKIGFLCLVLCSALACLVDSAAVDRPPDTPGPETTDKVASVADIERQLKKAVNSGVKMLLPYVMPTVTEVKLSTGCQKGLLRLVRDVMGIQDWAVRMMDATGKPSAGILEGTATALGDYDECLDIVVPKNLRPLPSPPYKEEEIDFTGQYCMLQIHLPEGLKKAAMDYQAGNRSTSELANSKTFLRSLVKIAPRADIAEYRFGLCIPSSCDLNELQGIINEVSKMIMVKATAMRCEKKEGIIFRVEHYIILSIIALIVSLVMLGTAMETLIRLNSTLPIIDIMDDRGKVVQFILAFSAPNNLQRLFSTKTSNTEKITCIRGIKFYSIYMYIIVWTYASPHDFHFFKYRGAFHFYKFLEEWWFTLFANSSIGIDSIFLVAGLQVTYRLWKKSEKGNVKISIPKFILKWFLRLSLAQLIAVGLFLCLPLLGNGPIWDDIVTPIIDNCRERWWLNVLSINNFWSSLETCLPHTWIMSSLMHLLILAPIVLFILSKWTSVGIFVNVILILGSSVAIAMVTLMNDLPPAPSYYFLSYINLRAIWDKLFIQAYDHVTSFSIGMLLAFLLSRYDKIQLKRIVVIIGWCCAIACNSAIVSGLYGYRHGESMDMTLSALYASIHRLGWSLGIAWIIFACAYGYAGVVDKILSWRFLIPMERLTILIFILHPIIIYLHEGQLRERLFMGHLDQFVYATAYIVFTLVSAIIIYVIAVSPFTYFEKKLWERLDPRSSREVIQDTPKLKRKESKPTIIEIGPSIEKAKYFAKLKWDSDVETKSFQT